VSEAPNPVRQRRGGLSRTLSLIFVALALLPALAGGVVFYARTSVALEQASLHQVESLADLRRIDVLAWVEQRSRTLAALSNDVDLLGALTPGEPNPAAATTWLDVHANEDPAFAAILIVRSSDGQVWAASRTRATITGETFPGWKSVRPTGVSPARYEPGLASDRLSLLFTAVVQTPDTPDTWTLVGEASVPNLQTLVSSLSETRATMRAFLVTAEGDPLLGANGSAPVPLGGEAVRAATAGEDGSGRFAGAQSGETSVAAYRWLGEELGLSLIIEQSYLDVVAPLSGAAIWALLALLPALLVLAVAVWGLMTRRLAPLQTIVETAQRFSGGALTASVPPQTDQEIDAVATAFNRLTSDLRRQFSALEGQANARAVQLAAAEAVLAATTAPQRLTVLLAQGCNAIQEHFPVETVLVFLPDEQDGRLHLRAGTETVTSRLRARNLSFAIDATTTVGWAALERAPRLSPDVSEDNLYTPFPELPELRSAIALPMLFGDEVVGVIMIGARQTGAFGSPDLPAYQIVAHHLAIAVANSRQYERSQRTRLVEDVVVALAGEVSQTTDPERILSIGARVLGLALDARKAVIRIGTRTEPQPTDPSAEEAA